MNRKPKLIMLMGVPASGKSTKAMNLKEKMEKVVLLSSDSLREEMFGNRQDTEHHVEVFNELHKRMKEALKSGVDVIYDATNINSKRRIGVLKQLPKDVTKELYYMCESHDSVIMADITREESVGGDVINKMYKRLQIPYTHEKWDKITVDLGRGETISTEKSSLFKEKVKEMTTRLFSYDEFVDLLYFSGLLEVKRMINLPQDNPFHTFTVDKHSYYVYEYIFKYYNKKDKEDLVLASIFHDIGKPFCKTYEEGLRYARYYGHDNVGGQITLRTLMQLGYSQSKALRVAELVGLHMRMSFTKDFEADKKLEKLVGDEKFIKLNYIRQGDIQAK